MLKTGLLLNPRLPMTVVHAMTTAWNHLADWHPEIFLSDSIGISTSGSTSGGIGSIIVLSREALEASAAAVNRRLATAKRDVWGLGLPLFHVGGYSIPMRAQLSGSSVVHFEEDWNARKFGDWLREKKVSLLSMVPTQLFDLIEAGLSAPPDMRAVIIGGGRLDEALHEKSLQLGWPILQSYGMTECSSQIATASLGSDGRMLEKLDHVELRIDESSKLWIRSKALLSARIVFDSSLGSNISSRLELPVSADGWFETSDRVELHPSLRILGREGESVKVMGELVDLARVRLVCERLASQFDSLSSLRQKTWVVSIPDERKENELVLVVESPGTAGLHSQTHDQIHNQGDELISKLRDELSPFEVPSRVMLVDEIPRSSLGKVLSTLLTAQALKVGERA